MELDRQSEMLWLSSDLWSLAVEDASHIAAASVDDPGGLSWEGTCAGSCKGLTLLLGRAPDGEDFVEIEVQWDGTRTAGFEMKAIGPDGLDLPVQEGFDATRVVVKDTDAGEFALSLVGHGAYVATARFVSNTAWDLEYLPNLVTMVPRGISMGCTPYEESEQGAQRCLRLGNGVGNVGYGPLHVQLSIPDGALSVAGMGQFVQRIYHPSGDYRDEPVAGAQFHLTHAHFHYAGLATFSLYEYDEETGLRGAQVGSDKKSGFCFIDVARMPESEVKPADRGQYGLTGCLIPFPSSWRMGVSPGWYDYYGAGLDEQYVEISGVPDGVYELVSVADGENTLLETDDTDNAASAIVRLAGETVQVLDSRGYYHM